MRYAIHNRYGHVVPATDEVLRNRDFWEITPETALAIGEGRIKSPEVLLQYRENLRTRGIGDPTPDANDNNNVRKSSFTKEPEKGKVGPFNASIPVSGAKKPGESESEGDTGSSAGEGAPGVDNRVLTLPPQIGQMKHASLLKLAQKFGVTIPDELAAADTPENKDAIRDALKKAASASLEPGVE